MTSFCIQATDSNSDYECDSVAELAQLVRAGTLTLSIRVNKYGPVVFAADGSNEKPENFWGFAGDNWRELAALGCMVAAQQADGQRYVTWVLLGPDGAELPMSSKASKASDSGRSKASKADNGRKPASKADSSNGRRKPASKASKGDSKAQSSSNAARAEQSARSIAEANAAALAQLQAQLAALVGAMTAGQ